MNGLEIHKIIRSNNKCPKCNTTFKRLALMLKVKNDMVTINCNECGYVKKVDKNNKEVRL